MDRNASLKIMSIKIYIYIFKILPRTGGGGELSLEGLAPKHLAAKAFNPQRLNQSSSAQPV